MKIPQLRVCLTDVCDKKCFYCRPEGEGRNSILTNEKLNSDDFIYLINKIVDNGVSVIRFTGGEPLLNNDIFKIIRALKFNHKIQEISLVTRSLYLPNEICKLKEAGLDNITLSLDSLQSRRLVQISQVDYLKSIVQGINECKKYNLPTKINIVIMKNINDDEIQDFITFAESIGNIELKFLDYMILPKQFKPYSEYFFKLDKITEYLRSIAINEENEFSTQAGGLGTPMPKFILKNNVIVYIKDSTVGSHYGDVCENCNFYPCQDALMSLRLTTDGRLQRCLYREDNLIPLLQFINDEQLLQNVIKGVLDTYKYSNYKPNVWNPCQ